MARIKRFNESYGGSSELIMEVNDILSKDEVYENIKSVLNSIPKNLKSKLKDYFSNNFIDVDQLSKIEQRFNILQKVKNLYEKGVRSVSDIFDRIYPKKEGIIFGIAISIFILIIIVYTCVALGWIFRLPKHGIKGFILAMCLTIPFLFTEMALWPVANYAAAMIEYKINGESEHVKVQEDKNGKLKVVEVKTRNLEFKDTRDIPTEPNW